MRCIIGLIYSLKTIFREHLYPIKSTNKKKHSMGRLVGSLCHKSGFDNMNIYGKCSPNNIIKSYFYGFRYLPTLLDS